MPTPNGAPYDVAIVGAGVCGAAIARLLSRYRLRVALLEREADVSFGTSKANSGIVHGGFHHAAHFLKTRLEVAGAARFDRLREELGFPFARCGILVAASHPDDMPAIEHLRAQGEANGIKNLEICSRQRMLELEPKLSPEVCGGLYAPDGGIVEPYRYVFALVENARANGVELLTEFEACAAERIADPEAKLPLWAIRSSDGRTVRARFAVNAAGLFADAVSAAFGAERYEIRPRKGEYFLLDRLAEGHPGRVVFPVPNAVSKGMLVIPTVEGTTLIGPTADPVDDKDDVATTQARLSRIVESAKTLVPSVSEKDAITSFAGLRPVLGEDFYVAPSDIAEAFVQVAGVQSPGLTASPAIAEYVRDLLAGLGLDLTEKADWNPRVEAPVRPRNLPPEERAALVAANPAHGHIVCRCEEVSEAEIVEAIRHGHVTLDGIKFYTRAQMGRCQGGFCTYRIIRILMRETGMSFDEITKRGKGSRILESELGDEGHETHRI